MGLELEILTNNMKSITMLILTMEFIISSTKKSSRSKSRRKRMSNLKPTLMRKKLTTIQKNERFSNSSKTKGKK
jgi:hypothetical protein